MKKGIKRILLATSFLVVILALAACNKTKPNPDPVLEVEAISTVLESKVADSKVLVRGTIYYVVDNGFYLSDSELGKVFVQTGKTFEDSVGIAIGKEVEVKGTFRVLSDKPYIDTVTEMKLVSAAGTLPVAKVSTVSQILGKDKTSKTGSWYAYVELKGKITVDGSTMATKFVDDAGHEIIFTSASSLDVLKSKLDTRVTIKALVSEYAAFGNAWRIAFVGSAADIVSSPFTSVEVKNMLSPWLASQVPSEIKGSLSLPAYYAGVDDVLITWSTTIPTDIEILALDVDATNYKTKISLPDHDVVGVLTATVHYMEEAPFDINFNVTVKQLVAVSLEQALNSGDDIVMFNAVIVGFASGQTNSYQSYIVQDLTNPNVTITVDFDRISFGDYGLLTLANAQIGDVVIVAGTHRTDAGGERPSIINPIVTTKTGAQQTPVYDLANAPVFTDEASWRNFPGFNKLVQIVNPFMRYSTSGMPGEENWIRLGQDAEPARKYGPSNNRVLALLIRPVDQLLGSEWRLGLDIKTTAGDPVMYEGSIYGYFVYMSDTYIQFVIVDANHVKPSARLQAIQDIKHAIPSQHELGDIELPTTHPSVTGEIVWTSSNPDVVSAAGVVTFPELDAVVTLTATFMVGSEEVVVSGNVLIVGQVKVVLQVDKVLADGVDGDMFNVEGIVLSGGYNTVGGLSDIYLQDKVSGNIVIVQGLTTLGTLFNIGDLIEFGASLKVDSNATGNEFGKKTITYTMNLAVVQANFGVLDYHKNAILVDSHETALTALAADALVFGGVYFFNGNYFFNATTSAYSGTGSLNGRFHMNPAATAIADIRYGAGKNLVINDAANRANLGDTWVEDFLGITSTNYPGTKYPGYSYNGGFYAVLKNASDSYYYWSILSATDFVSESNAAIVARDLKEAIPANITGGNLTLPLANDLVTGAIAWSSDKPLVISDTGVVTYGDTDTVVVLTATYTLDGVVVQTAIEINVLALPVLSVGGVITTAANGDIVKVKGIVVGFHWDGSTLSGTSHGIMIKDASGNELLYVTGLINNYGTTRAVYVVGEGAEAHTLALGDEIEFSAVYGVSTTVGTIGRKTLNITSAAAANMQIKNQSVAYSFNKATAIEIATEADLNALAENLQYGVLYKLVGPFTLKSSATSIAAANMLVGFGTSNDALDYNHVATWATVKQRFTIKMDGNVPHLGDKWWEAKLGLVPAAFKGTTVPHFFAASSEVYFYVGNTNQMSGYGYVQLVVLQADHVSGSIA